MILGTFLAHAQYSTRGFKVANAQYNCVQHHIDTFHLIRSAENQPVNDATDLMEEGGGADRTYKPVSLG